MRKWYGIRPNNLHTRDGEQDLFYVTGQNRIRANLKGSIFYLSKSIFRLQDERTNSEGKRPKAFNLS